MTGATLSKFVISSCAAIAALWASAPAMAQDTARFEVGGTSYTATIPTGFCLPEGEQVQIADYIASLDPVNETKLHVFECGVGVEAEYIIVKVPKNAPQIPLPKPQVIELLAQQMESQFGKQLVEEELSKAESTVSEKTDGQIRMSGTQTSFAGTDSDCAYLNGSSQVDDPTGTQIVIYSSCLSPNNSIIFAVHSYAVEGEGTAYAALSERSSAMARSITAVGD